VEAARARQVARTGDPRLVNAAVPGRLARSILKTTPEARALLTRAVDRLTLSARGFSAFCALPGQSRTYRRRP